MPGDLQFKGIRPCISATFIFWLYLSYVVLGLCVCCFSPPFSASSSLSACMHYVIASVSAVLIEFKEINLGSVVLRANKLLIEGSS